MNIVFYGGGNIAQAVAKGFMLSTLETDNIFYIDRNKKNQDKLKKLQIKNFKNESIEILELQAEGKKIMKSSDFLRGNKL